MLEDFDRELYEKVKDEPFSVIPGIEMEEGYLSHSGRSLVVTHDLTRAKFDFFDDKVEYAVSNVDVEGSYEEREVFSNLNSQGFNPIAVKAGESEVAISGELDFEETSLQEAYDRLEELYTTVSQM